MERIIYFIQKKKGEEILIFRLFYLKDLNNLFFIFVMIEVILH